VTEPKATETQLRLGWKKDAEFPLPVYANYVQGSFTPEDFTINLGVYALPPTPAISDEGAIDIEVQPVVRVVLPLNLMRSVIALLQLQLQNYEANFGPIQEHPNKPDWLEKAEDA
jgi:hypothetical protein